MTGRQGRAVFGSWDWPLILLWPAQAVGLGDRSVDWFKRDLRRALVVCNDPSLQAASQAAVQKQQLWQLVDHAFQGDVIIPAILRQTWPALTEAEHDRLWPVVNYAIKWKIIGKLFMFHLREVSFTTEGKGDEGYFLDGYLETRLFSHPTRFIFVDRPEGWAAYDVVVDGFSLMEHYRRKFDSTYFTGGLDGLLRQLASEVNDDFQEMGYTPPGRTFFPNG